MAKTIACLGSSAGSLGEPAYDAMVEVGRLLAKRVVRVVTGGFGGIGMEAPARGVKEAEGVVVGYTMWGKRGNEFLTYTSPQHRESTNTEMQFCLRLGHILQSDSFIIARDQWGPGTIMELLGIINLNLKLWMPSGKGKRLAILTLVQNQNKDTNIISMITDGEDWRSCMPLILPTCRPEEAVGWVLGD